MGDTSENPGELHVVVTGGTGGLGQAVVKRLLAGGAHCHLPCFEKQLPDLALLAEPRVTATAAIDLTDESSATTYFAGLPSLWASVHLAGGFAMANLVDTSLADFGKLHTLNTTTCFLSCREAVRAMRRTGGGGGRIVNVAARPAVAPAGGMIAYTASKAAVASMTQTLAAELAPERILVNAILPSIIDTEANRQAMPDADHASWPTPAEIAETIHFLISAENTLTSGALIPVYGAA